MKIAPGISKKVGKVFLGVTLYFEFGQYMTKNGY